MSEQEAVVKALRRGRILDAIRWAYQSAAAGVADDFRPGKGYDEGWCGFSRHTLLRDRLNRVFSLGPYITPVGTDPRENLDILFEAIPESERATFPLIAPGLVEEADLNGSPGWKYKRMRLLIASIPHDDIDDITWQRRSATKQLVASQPDPDRDGDGTNTLLHRLAAAGDTGAKALLDAIEAAKPLDIPTYLIGHGHDLIGGGRRRLVLGRPQLQAREPWAWTENLLTTHPPTAGGLTPPATTPDPTQAPDAPVRLRRPADTKDPRAADGTPSGGAVTSGGANRL
ncbi:hypothetical protein [Nocardioides nanhaiensis]|uniref:Uncharacterized protein n=1 Tax=Nocardioides nanhaiensis TaxID=1476871 RepID=A0ABP8W873_9ACTN